MQQITLQQLIDNRLLQIPEIRHTFTVSDFDQYREELSKQGGIYIFKDGQDILYIGISKDLEHRLKEHLSGKGKGNKQIGKSINTGKELTISVLYETNKVYQEFYEGYLLQIHQPPFNTKKLGQSYTLEGDFMGKPPLPDSHFTEAIEMYKTGEYKIKEITSATGVKKATLYRRLKQAGLC